MSEEAIIRDLIRARLDILALADAASGVGEEAGMARISAARLGTIIEQLRASCPVETH